MLMIPDGCLLPCKNKSQLIHVLDNLVEDSTTTDETPLKPNPQQEAREDIQPDPRGEQHEERDTVQDESTDDEPTTRPQ